MAVAHPAGQVHELVWTALRVFDAHPSADQDEILEALAQEGLLEESAWALYQMVPVAMTHAAMRPKGVEFPSTYLLLEDTRKIEGAVQRAWNDDPLYVSAAEIAEHLLAQGNGPHLEPLLRAAAHSAEMNVVRKLSNDGSDPGDIVFTETLVMSFSAWDREKDWWMCRLKETFRTVARVFGLVR